MNKPYGYIWAYRFCVSRGWMGVRERDADTENQGKLWLDVFRDDEPNTAFRLSAKQPKEKLIYS